MIEWGGGGDEVGAGGGGEGEAGAVEEGKGRYDGRQQASWGNDWITAQKLHRRRIEPVTKETEKKNSSRVNV
jgi:hypothetical protein